MTAHLRRTLTVLLSVLLLAGCYSEEEIAATRDALDQLETDLLDDHPELTDVDANYDVSTGFDNVGQIYIVADANLDSDDHGRALVETIAEQTWHSQLPQISGLRVDIRQEGTQERHTLTDVLDARVVRRDVLEGRFGPRDQD